ncbi:MAG: SUMF1/EgtB/PvdO family nonheme iron enzyme [Planctomycetaceae bacterium]
MSEESIFAEAVRIDSPQERDKFLTAACSNDASMQARVRQLLRLHEDAGSFLEKSPAAAAGDATVVWRDTHDDGMNSGGPSAARAAFPHIDLSFLTPSDKEGCLGTIGQYEVVGIVGEGGMGIVFKAFDTRLHRTVALKFLSPQLAANANARRRFLREAQAAAAVVHPHVVTIHAVDDSSLPFLVMEFIGGLSLKDLLERDGALQVREILRIGSQLASGLAAAHHQGLIHRDIKPGNILLENGVQRVKITDFGLARAADDVSMTRTGEVAGTPQYMSPEQARGEQIDQRSDLFSMGSVLYAMCTGRAPFRADTTMGVLKRVCDDAPRPIREVNAEIPDWLEAFVGRLLEKSPKNRIQTAAEAGDVLAHYLACVQQPSQVVRPISPIARQQKNSKRSTASGWLTALLLIFVLLPCIAFWKLYPAPKVPGEADGAGSSGVTLPVASPVPPLPPEGRAEPEEIALTSTAPPVAVLPFDSATARHHQQVWADYLGVPVEYNVSLGMTFRLIPPGDFMMGEGAGYIDRNLQLAPTDPYWQFIIGASGPVHRVRITRPFYMATTEVTVEQYRRFVEQSGYVTVGEQLHPNDRNWRKLSETSSDRNPVGYLTWNDCKALCDWLSQKEVAEYDLPTEAQWEFACRAGSNSRWCYGDEPSKLSDYAWFGKSIDTPIAEVGGRRPNAFGLFDMHGNVSEWCRDWHQRDFYTRGPAVDPFCSDEWKSPDVRSQVLRGGAWVHQAEFVSSGCPRHYAPDVNFSYPDHGFRPVMIADLSRGSHFPARAEASEMLLSEPLDFFGSTLDAELGVHALQVTPDGSQVVTGHYDGQLAVWDIASRREERVIDAHDATIQGLILLDGGRRAATAAEDGTIRLWDLTTGERLQEFIGHQARTDSLAVLADASVLISGSADHTGFSEHLIRKWNINTGERLGEFGETTGVTVEMAALHEKLVTLDNRPGRLMEWDVTSGEPLHVVRLESPSCMAVSASGRYAVVGHAVESAETQERWDNPACVLTLIDLTSWQTAHVFQGHRSPVAGVAFSPDETHIVSISGGGFTSTGEFLDGADSSIRMWNVVTKSEVARVDCDDRLLNVAFHPKGSSFITGGTHHLRQWSFQNVR